jgi:hypothetical protein
MKYVKELAVIFRCSQPCASRAARVSTAAKREYPVGARPYLPHYKKGN